jgi:hypothetical protein
LELESDIWKQASVHALELLSDSNDESLVAAITYVLKAASQCQHLSVAVCLPVTLLDFLLAQHLLTFHIINCFGFLISKG